MSADNAEGIFNLQIITPEREAFNGPVKSLTCTGESGVFEVLANHEPILAPLAVGLLGVSIPDEDTEKLFALHGGFLEMLPNGKEAIIMANTAESGDDIDLDRARNAIQRAKERLAANTDKESTMDIDRAKLALIRAITRVDAVERKVFA